MHTNQRWSKVLIVKPRVPQVAKKFTQNFVESEGSILQQPDIGPYSVPV